jgi:flagellar biosynthesis/type III secretory pathway M-ring protein FliF/YscJ
MNAVDGSLLFSWALNAFALALLYVCAFRPLLRLMGEIEASCRRRRLPAGPVGGAPPGPPPLPAVPGAAFLPAEAAPERRSIEEARRVYEEVCAFAAANPEKTTDILRAWMKERS